MNSENQVKRLTVDDIAVPEGMLDAFMVALLEGVPDSDLKIQRYRESWRKDISAALLWLANNPIVPSGEELDKIWHGMPLSTEICPYFSKMSDVFAEYQKVMFKRKQDALPDEVKSLLLDESPLISEHSRPTRPFYNSAVLKAYKLGKSEGK